jgi:hypothetical protein
VNCELSVYVSENNINAADDGNYVSQQRTFDHWWQSRQIDKGWSANANAIWALGSVADDVIGDFSAS